MAQNSEKTVKKPRGPGRKWPKGVSGNPGGRPKSETSITAILRRMAEERKEGDAKSRAEMLADKLWNSALAGDRMTSEYLVDRLDGKAQESMNLSGGLSIYEQGVSEAARIADENGRAALLAEIRKLSGRKK